ncbi:MAG: thiamine phosphate synthase [Lachnospiraceae bacterium]
MIIFMCSPYEHAIAITNRTLVQGDFLEQMKKVIRLHPHAVILREKDLSDEEYESLAEKFWPLCERERSKLLSALQSFDCAQIWDADGSISPFRRLQTMSEAERLRTADGIFRRSVCSCHSMEDMNIAVEKRSDIRSSSGQFFETDCKKG